MTSGRFVLLQVQNVLSQLSLTPFQRGRAGIAHISKEISSAVYLPVLSIRQRK